MRLKVKDRTLVMGKTYHLDGLSVLVVDSIKDVRIIALQKRVDLIAQFPFVPVHKDVLADFVVEARRGPEFEPNDISETLALWQKDGAAYFTIPIPDIWTLGIQLLKAAGKKPSEYIRQEVFCFSPIWPSNNECGIGHYFKMHEVIGATHNSSSN